MIFDSKSNFSISKYQINMEEIITPYYNLVLELCNLTENKEVVESVWIESIFNIPQILERDHIPEFTGKDAFLSILAEYLENQLYQHLNNLHRNITFLYRDEKIVISKCEKKQEVEKALSKWVKSYNPVERLFELVTNENVIKLSESFKTFYNESTYSSCIKVTDYNLWQSCILKNDWLDFADIQESDVDPSSIWIGSEIKDELGKMQPDCIKQLQNSHRTIGVSCDEILIPFECVDKFITEDSYPSYFWEMLDSVYTPTPKGVVSNKEHELFLEAGKDPEFSRLLSYLQYNLYIADDIPIPDNYVDMFEPVYCLNKLPGLENYMLFVGCPSDEQGKDSKTLSGTYEIKKTESDYNLRNWVSATQNGYTVTKSNNTRTENCKAVYALKPQYSYYFISKYYEDSFSSILTEIGCNHKCCIYLYKEGENNPFIEIDAFIARPDGKFIYVENKTCMSKDNIDATLKKIVDFQELIKEYKNIKIDYYLTSPYCDNSLEHNFLYFIGEDNIQTRDGVKHKLYNFDIPLAQFENITLHCIVEPEYNKMKAIISEILK